MTWLKALDIGQMHDPGGMELHRQSMVHSYNLWGMKSTCFSPVECLSYTFGLSEEVDATIMAGWEIVYDTSKTRLFFSILIWRYGGYIFAKVAVPTRLGNPLVLKQMEIVGCMILPLACHLPLECGSPFTDSNSDLDLWSSQLFQWWRVAE